MALETVPLEHLPDPYSVHVGFFRSVRNAPHLHAQLLARNADFEYALIDASVIVSRTHLLSAVFKAVNSDIEGELRTPNVHSEIVTGLSASSNIAEAYRRFGITKDTKDLLVVKVTKNHEPPAVVIGKHLSANVEGEQVDVTDEDIEAVTDLSKVAKYYKLNGLSWFDGIKDKTAKRKELEMLVLGSMALRGV